MPRLPVGVCMRTAVTPAWAWVPATVFEVNGVFEENTQRSRVRSVQQSVRMFTRTLPRSRSRPRSTCHHGSFCVLVSETNPALMLPLVLPSMALPAPRLTPLLTFVVLCVASGGEASPTTLGVTSARWRKPESGFWTRM